MRCPAAAWAAFQDAKPPFYFFDVHFVGVNASHGQKLIFRQRIACHNKFAIHAIQQ